MENNITGNTYQEETIDLKKILFKILSNWYWFVLSVFIAFIGAYIINRYAPQVYTVNASVIVRDDEKGKGLTGAENVVKGLEIFQSKKNVQNEIGILQSYQLSNITLQQLPDFKISYFSVGRSGLKETNLYKSCPFVVYLDTIAGTITDSRINITILSRNDYKLEVDGKYNIKKTLHFGEPFKHQGFNFAVVLKDKYHFALNEKASNKYYFVVNDLNTLTNQYKKKLTITVNDKKGSILILSTQGSNPQQESDFLNHLLEEYIQYGLEEKNQTAVNTIRFINEQLVDIVDSLTAAENTLQNFRLANKVINISQEGNMIYQELTDIESQKAVIEVKLKYYQYLLNYVTKKDNLKDVIVPSAMGIDDPVLGNLLSKLADLNVQKSVVQYSSKENNPALEMVNIEIKNNRSALIENIKNNINTTNLAKADIEKRISIIESTIQRIPVNERRLISIQRKFNLNDQIYTYLLQKRAESGIAKASNIPDNKILDVALPENALLISPKKSLNKMIAIILGLLIPMAIIFIIDFLNNKIVDKKDIENSTNVPILGSIGHSMVDSELPVFENPKSSLAESFRSIRTSLQYYLTDPSKKSISINSTLSGEGKTFSAVNLATIIAMSNKKTLLVGLDLRKPRIHNIFNLDNNLGLSTYFINRNTFEEIIIPTNINNLYISPSGPVPPNPAELLETPKVKEFFDLAKKQFDYIIIDTPPIAIVTDALLLTKFTDLNVFVVRQNYSSKEVIKLVDDLYNKRNIKNLSILVNDIKPASTSSYSYGYEYGPSYKYSYGHKYSSDYYSEETKPLSFTKRILRALLINKD
jgi:tyrosine-protein kinase Etk/Wzc